MQVRGGAKFETGGILLAKLAKHSKVDSRQITKRNMEYALIERRSVYFIVGIILLNSILFIDKSDAYDNAQIDGECRKYVVNYSDESGDKMGRVVAAQLGLVKAKILGIWRLKKWSIVHADTIVYDQPFLFYSDDPTVSHYVTIWAGAAQAEDIKWIPDWVAMRAPGIYPELANCFAWDIAIGPDSWQKETVRAPEH